MITFRTGRPLGLPTAPCLQILFPNERAGEMINREDAIFRFRTETPFLTWRDAEFMKNWILSNYRVGRIIIGYRHAGIPATIGCALYATRRFQLDGYQPPTRINPPWSSVTWMLGGTLNDVRVSKESSLTPFFA